MDSVILKAAQFAKRAHLGQCRKYRPRPYIDHPARVAGQVSLLEGATPQMVAAGWLHDVIEDCGETAETLVAAGFDEVTVRIVVELTNPSKQHADRPRRERKAMDREHLAQVSLEAKRIKMIDMRENLLDSHDATDDFPNLYAAEALLLLKRIEDADTELAERVYLAIEELGYSRDHQHAKAGPV